MLTEGVISIPPRSGNDSPRFQGLGGGMYRGLTGHYRERQWGYALKHVYNPDPKEEEKLFGGIRAPTWPTNG